jgi:hypothetical protein
MTSSPSAWQAWHEPYDDPTSFLSRRLAEVQVQLAAALTDAPSGPIQLVSACAGQGRDLLGVLPSHARRDDVHARLVELDPGNVAVARRAAAGLPGVEIVQGDAGVTDAFRHAVPANVVLLCGVFGNITDGDIEGTIAALPQFCVAGAIVIWTRHRLPPDITPRVRQWFADVDFEEVSFFAPDDAFITVGVHRFIGTPHALRPGVRLFQFIEGAGGST